LHVLFAAYAKVHIEFLEVVAAPDDECIGK
jgi:hypothetical protein